MKTFTLTDLGNKFGEVMEAAFRGPVGITNHGKRKFVLMTVDDFDRLRGCEMRQAYRADKLSGDERELFLAGLDEVVASSVSDD
jgi:prevent-host-death family protein